MWRDSKVRGDWVDATKGLAILWHQKWPCVLGIGANDEERRDNAITMRRPFLVAPYLLDEESDGECRGRAAAADVVD